MVEWFYGKYHILGNCRVHSIYPWSNILGEQRNKKNPQNVIKLGSKVTIEICEHVYKIMNQNPCPKCGGETHETDWVYQNKLHREWIESGKATLQGWWSI